MSTHKPKPIEECLQQIQEALEQIQEIQEALDEKPDRDDLENWSDDLAFKLEELHEDVRDIQGELAEVKDTVDDLQGELAEVRVQGERQFAAARATVWRVLNSPESMAKTMPGVESFDVHDDRHWTANVKIPREKAHSLHASLRRLLKILHDND